MCAYIVISVRALLGLSLSRAFSIFKPHYYYYPTSERVQAARRCTVYQGVPCLGVRSLASRRVLCPPKAGRRGRYLPTSTHYPAYPIPPIPQYPTHGFATRPIYS